MGYKAFCDRCDKETSRNFVAQRGVMVLDGWCLELMVQRKGVWNDGVLCENCLHEIITRGELKEKTR